MTSKPEEPITFSRRDAIKHVSALLGGITLVGQSGLLAGRETDAPSSELFSARDIALLDEIADTILPETDTPGAKAAGVGPFMALMVTDSYYAEDQKIFRDGMRALDQECRDRFDADFVSASPVDRLALLERLDAEQLHYMEQRKEGDPAHFFRMMKELALLGYFTSEIGYTQAMRYMETPGRYDPCVPYAAGDKTWARHA